MEVGVSNLENINSKKWPLEHNNVEMLNFISSNGPDHHVKFWKKLALSWEI